MLIVDFDHPHVAGHHVHGHHHSHGHDTDKSELGDVSPPCTCGAADHSPDPAPERKHINHVHGDLVLGQQTVQQPPEVSRQGSGPSQRYKTSQAIAIMHRRDHSDNAEVGVKRQTNVFPLSSNEQVFFLIF